MLFRTKFHDGQLSFGGGSNINSDDIPQGTSNLWLTPSTQIISGSKNFVNPINVPASGSQLYDAQIVGTLQVTNGINGNISILMNAGETLSPGDVVYISGQNTVRKVKGSTSAILGVISSYATIGNLIYVILLGVINVVCVGNVLAGDLVIGAATGKVSAFRPGTTKNTSNGGVHMHDMNTGVNLVGSSTASSGYHNHSVSITPGEFSAGKIIGKALTAGQDTSIKIYVNCMG